MNTRRKLLIGGTVVLALAVVVLVTRGPAPPSPNPPGTFSFAVLGDAPYYIWEDWQFELVLQEMDANDLTWVLHVGDIFWRPCTDELYRSRLDWFNELRHPLIYTPGDNEWTDCWEPGSGGFPPLDRLERIRQIFFDDPSRSLGGRPLSLVSQTNDEPFPEFVENARWTHEGMVFATVHLVGSWNGLVRFDTRTPADDAEVERRTEAAAAWVRRTFEEARAADASAVVLAFHANPLLESPPDHAYRRTYEPFLAVLEEEVARFERPVLVVHGDDHDYIVDRPLVDRVTGDHLGNLTRMQVPGSPEVGWVRVVVTPGAQEPFAFQARVIPGWKYW